MASLVGDPILAGMSCRGLEILTFVRL